ncbi:YceI family protein [Burkholderiaceae bacterium DAT-1]|nr:YceI family protein [Burkholderiaceae bacterium DAT-1]
MFATRTIFTRSAMAAVIAASTLTVGYARPVDAKKSEVAFVFTQMNVPVTGRFKAFVADAEFAPAHPEQGKVSVSIDLLGTDAGSPDANESLKTDAWFASKRFPRATFTASGFKAIAGGKFEATGTLSLKGRTAQVTIPFSSRTDAAGQWLEGAFPLQRLSWKIGEGEWADVGTVADAVQVKFRLLVPGVK